MTKEQIEQRRADLFAQLQQAQQARDAQQRLADTLNGAVQDCDHWLAELAKTDQKAPKPELVKGAGRSQ